MGIVHIRLQISTFQTIMHTRIPTQTYTRVRAHAHTLKRSMYALISNIYFPAGTVFYQGDIILHRDDEKYIYGEKSNRRKRATMRLRHRLWKNGRVPYEIDSRISECL